MGDRPSPGSHPHHPHCHRHPPVQEVSAVLRTPGDGHLSLDSQAIPRRGSFGHREACTSLHPSSGLGGKPGGAEAVCVHMYVCYPDVIS